MDFHRFRRREEEDEDEREVENDDDTEEESSSSTSRAQRLPWQAQPSCCAATAVNDDPHSFVFVPTALQGPVYQQRVAQARQEMVQVLMQRLQDRQNNNNTKLSRSNNHTSLRHANPQGEEEEEDEQQHRTTTTTPKQQPPPRPFPQPDHNLVATAAAGAKTLERLLFQQSKQNLTTYQDMATLDDRLRTLQMVLVRKRMMKKNKQQQQGGHPPNRRRRIATRTTTPSIRPTTTTPTTRNNSSSSHDFRKHEYLRQVLLGPTLYADIAKLVQDIQRTKQSFVAANCFCGGGGGSGGSGATNTCPPQQRPPFALDDDVHSSSSSSSLLLPKPVQALYFQTTPLLDCWNLYPLERLSNNIPWKLLYHQAHTHLLEFRKWQQQQQQAPLTEASDDTTMMMMPVEDP